MKLFYIDETKYQPHDPYLLLGGVIIGEEEISPIEDGLKQIQKDFFGSYFLDKSIELHGHHIFKNQGAYEGRDLKERLGLFEKVANLITKHKVPIRISCIDVNMWRNLSGESNEYFFGMCRALSLFSDYLKEVNDIGLIFADNEENEMIASIHALTVLKEKSNEAYEADIAAIKDTIYYTHSHHSRFLQVADLVLYMANRYENNQKQPITWHDKTLYDIWQNIRNSTDYELERQ